MRPPLLLAGILTACVVMTSPLAAQTYETITVRDTVGWPDPNPIWVNGGGPMSIRFNMSTSTWLAAGIRITIEEPATIHTISGVMANSGSSAWTSPLHINVHSSPDQFGTSALEGDVHHDTQAFFANLSNGSPPAWGGADASGKMNHWVDLGFEPFVLEPGDYVISVQAYLVGAFLSWTETLNSFGIQSDIFTSHSMQPDWVEFTRLGSVYGNPAVFIQGTPIVPQCPISADLNCDGVVNVSDLLILLGDWGACTEPDACPADLNDDGVVNVSDLLILLSNWG